VEDTDFETFQYEAEDGELELGLNCLVHQSFTPVREANIEQVIVSNITEEITCADFDELLIESDLDDTNEMICEPEFGEELALFSLSTAQHADNHCSHDKSRTKLLSSIVSPPDRCLVVRRVLSTQLIAAEHGQCHNLFQSRCRVEGQVCRFIIDGGSCNNVISATLVEKLGMQTHRRPHPYHMQ
jgi:hypothetical protein